MASLTEIYSAMLAATQALSQLTVALTSSTGNMITALNALNTNVTNLHTTGTSTTAPAAGTVGYSSQAAGFMITVSASGATVKVPFYV